MSSKSDLTVIAEKFGMAKTSVHRLVKANPQLGIVAEPGKPVRLTQFQASALCSIIENSKPNNAEQLEGLTMPERANHAETVPNDETDEADALRARVRELELAKAKLEQRVEDLEAMLEIERKHREEVKNDLDRERTERNMAIVKAETAASELAEARSLVDRINSAGLFARMFRKF